MISTQIKMNQNFKTYVESIVPYEPGKPIEEVERELGVRNVAKLASNENPLGPSPKAVRAMKAAIKKVNFYPDGSCLALKKRLATYYDLSDKNFIIGNGSNEIIEFLARGFLKEGDKVISSMTSFLVYPLITQVVGAVYEAIPMKDFRYDLQGVLRQIDDRTKLIFISNPNNPTGTYVRAKNVARFLKEVPEHVIVCFDEAYVDFVEAKDFPNLLDEIHGNRSNLILLRTFSKSYGLAGLRIGYGIATPELVAYLQKIRQPFNVNHLAQVAAEAALTDGAFLNKTKKTVSEGKLFLCRKLTEMNLDFASSEANFVLVNVVRDSKKVSRMLMKLGLIVRPMTAYGLDQYIRITIGTQGELARLVRALKQVLKQGD
jgi:histidinol-phosphate aminotransferase